MPDDLQLLNYGSTFGRKQNKREVDRDSPRAVMAFGKKPASPVKLRRDNIFDWSETELFKACQRVPRFKRPLIKDARAVEITHYLSSMKK